MLIAPLCGLPYAILGKMILPGTLCGPATGFDGYEAAFVNFRLIASDVWSTAKTVRVLSTLK
jgi:biuret amidohydrolase